MTLKDCTKEELIFVIKRLQFYSLGDSHYVDLALRDAEYERNIKRNTEAQRLSKYAAQKRQEYIELIAPYEGKRIVDVPYDVMEKADAALKAARAADSKWNKIMGISRGRAKKRR